MIGGSLILYAWRAKQVGLGGKFDVVSRESLLLANNVLLTVAAGSVLLGTLYPLIVDALGEGEIVSWSTLFQSRLRGLDGAGDVLDGCGTDRALEESERA